MKKLILLGAGGHCKSCIDVIEQEGKYEIMGILDIPEMVGKKILDYPVIGTDDEIGQFAYTDTAFLITVGQISSPSIRIKLSDLLKKHQATLATVISPRAYVSKYATVGAGTIIMHDALINASATIGKHCIINTKALVEHDACVEDFCHISTGAVLNGGTHICRGTFVGSNCASKEYSETKENDFVKAGSVMKGKRI